MKHEETVCEHRCNLRLWLQDKELHCGLSLYCHHHRPARRLISNDFSQSPADINIKTLCCWVIIKQHNVHQEQANLYLSKIKVIPVCLQIISFFLCEHTVNEPSQLFFFFFQKHTFFQLCCGKGYQQECWLCCHSWKVENALTADWMNNAN